MIQDYKVYTLSNKEKLKGLLECLVLFLILDYLFYRSYLIILFFPVVGWVYLRKKKEELIRRRRNRIEEQFKDALYAIQVAIQAGYSAENAMLSCVRDLILIHGRDAEMVKEFEYINKQRKLSVPLEQLFLELAQRTDLEDIENFASVFHTAKRTGGNMNKVLEEVLRLLGDKMTVKREILSALSAKKTEQKIMSMMPLMILAYLQLSSPGFLDVLYGNLLGAGIMSICLFFYILAYLWGKQLVEIQI